MVIHIGMISWDHIGKTNLVVVSYQYLAGGRALPLWKMMEFFISADDIPRMEKNNMFQTWKKHVPNHQPEIGANDSPNRELWWSRFGSSNLSSLVGEVFVMEWYS